MKFKVTQIELDFDEPSEDLGEQEKAKLLEEDQEIQDNIFCTVWDADDEDDLIEEITCAFGFCIKKIDYVHVLS